VGLNSRRIGFYNLLIKHGAKIKFKNIKIINNEKIGDIEVQSSRIKSISASSNYSVAATDEYPNLFIITALTKGTSILKEIKYMANKESNRF